MEKGRYFKYIGENCSNMRQEKLYPIINVGNLMKRGGKELLIVDEKNKKRAFSMTDLEPDVHYKVFGEIINVNHDVDDMLDKLNMYKSLVDLFGDKPSYSKVIKRIEAMLETISINDR